MGVRASQLPTTTTTTTTSSSSSSSSTSSVVSVAGSGLHPSRRGLPPRIIPPVPLSAEPNGRHTTATTTTTARFAERAGVVTATTVGALAVVIASLLLSIPVPAEASTATAATTAMLHNGFVPGNSAAVRTAPMTLALEPASSPYTGALVDTTGAPVVKLDSGVTYRDLRGGNSGDESSGVATEGKRVNIQWVLKRSNGYTIDASTNNDGVPFIFVVAAAAVATNHNNNNNNDASTNNDGVPFIFVVGGGGGSNESQQQQQQQQQPPPRAIAGLDEGIRGMRVGGIRRIVIPPSLAYVEGLNDDGSSPGPVPVGFGPKQRIRRVMENRMDVPDESFLLDVKLTRVQ
eukprot:CAMPEP_0201251766 /NCGR_PEP_ID=MMETSP0852-20130820/66527_1 /ASSEMBLY_ACC=CAM_ASM_000632 /TAXON_ID=183588 /ORGANISM="Pseudo-nitzschia fraudulenta, Strain WWA7" /LENGTH=345 /DNA_ID=CAMNT_0047551381 /DNA_START=275 /DNA_END=1314 /DNA_ORIENTATION=-